MNEYFRDKKAFTKYCKEQYGEKAHIILEDTTGVWTQSQKGIIALDVEEADSALRRQQVKAAGK